MKNVAAVEAGGNDKPMAHKTPSSAKAAGAFGFSFPDQDADKIPGSVVDGKAPGFDHVADGAWALT